MLAQHRSPALHPPPPSFHLLSLQDEDAEAKAQRLGRRLGQHAEQDSGDDEEARQPGGRSRQQGAAAGVSADQQQAAAEAAAEAAAARGAVAVTDGPISVDLPAGAVNGSANGLGKRQSGAGRRAKAGGAAASSEDGVLEQLKQQQRGGAAQQDWLFSGRQGPAAAPGRGKQAGAAGGGVSIGPASAEARAQDGAAAPAAQQQQGGGGAAPQPAFVRSKAFQGARPGYVFKKGPQGRFGEGRCPISTICWQFGKAWGPPIGAACGLPAAGRSRSEAACRPAHPAAGMLPTCRGLAGGGASLEIPWPLLGGRRPCCIADPSSLINGAGVGYYLDGAEAVKAAKAAKQRQKQAEAAARRAQRQAEAAAAAGRPGGGASDSEDERNMRPAPAGLSQEELIRRAFAGDDVQAEFAAAKAAEVEGELPQVGAARQLSASRRSAVIRVPAQTRRAWRVLPAVSFSCLPGFRPGRPELGARACAGAQRSAPVPAVAAVAAVVTSPDSNPPAPRLLPALPCPAVQEEVPGTLPGWGTWAGQQREPKWVTDAKKKAEQ